MRTFWWYTSRVLLIVTAFGAIALCLAGMSVQG